MVKLRGLREEAADGQLQHAGRLRRRGMWRNCCSRRSEGGSGRRGWKGWAGGLALQSARRGRKGPAWVEELLGLRKREVLAREWALVRKHVLR